MLAFGLAAATISNPVATGGTGSGPHVGNGAHTGHSTGGRNASTTSAPNGSLRFSTGICVRPLTTWQFGVGALLVVVAVLALAVRRDGWVRPFVFGFVLLVPAFVVYALLTQCGRAPSVAGMAPVVGPPNFSGATGPVGGSGSGPGGGPGVAGALPMLALVIVALLALAGFVVVRASGDTEAGAPPSAAESSDDETLSDVGRAAGEAAERLDAPDADAENEVYRAWRELTALLDVPRPASSTPGEFAEAARAAGMDAEHVDALTDVFREVRYGGETADETRERRASEALRAIEDAYGGAE